MRKIGLLWCWLLVICGVLTGCGPQYAGYIDFSKGARVAAPAVATEEKPLRIAITSVLSPQETIGYYRQLADHVTREMGRPMVLVQRKTYEELNSLLANDQVDLVFLSTGAYAAYRGITPIEMLVMVEWQGHSRYRTEVIVHKDSPYQSLEDLRDKVFAFTDPLSLSGHVMVTNYLWERQERPEKYFRRYIYTSSHDKSIWAVANRVVDGACMDSMVYEYAQEKNPDLAAQIKVIAQFPPTPTGPVVVNRHLPLEQRQRLRQVFLQMHEHPELHEAMRSLQTDRYVPPRPEEYEPLRELYDHMRGLS